MSLSLIERPRAMAAEFGRRWLAGADRRPGFTLFVGADCVWSYPRGAALPERFAGVEPWLESHSGTDVRLVLSAALTHQLVVTDPTLPEVDAEAMMAWARRQFLHYHGPSAERWPLSVWLGAQQRGASAAHGIDLDAVLRRAQALEVRLRAVQPWWAVALQAASHSVPTIATAEQAELWIVEATRASRIRCERGRVRQIEQHWLPSSSMSALAGLLTDCDAHGEATWVLGYGLDPDQHGGPTICCLGELDAEHPPSQWLGA